MTAYVPDAFSSPRIIEGLCVGLTPTGVQRLRPSLGPFDLTP
jgi:hypothetical protein